MKDFLEEYGFAILAAIVVILLITFTTPVGNAVQKSITSTIEQTTARTDNKMKIINNADDVNSIQESWTPEYIEFHKTHQNVSFDEYKKHLVKVNFNQIIINGNFDSSKGWGWNGTDYSSAKVQNNEIILDYLSHKDDWSQQLYRVKYADETEGIENHKYLMSYNIFQTKATENLVGINNYFKSVMIKNTDIWNRVGVIIENKIVAKNGFRIYFNHDIKLEVGDYVKIKQVNVFDLTAMFGEGNEPETLEQFREVFPNDYYEYNKGTEMMVYVPWMEA